MKVSIIVSDAGIKAIFSKINLAWKYMEDHKLSYQVYKIVQIDVIDK